ncbi:hypothetical protein [Streptomyces californicus]|uniref:hypothetical protein n=1 Tax=Streptomyces californicus TaxID=67351 RepID=UPI0035E28FD6
MTEYIAQCRAGRYDKIVARVDGDSVELAATSHGEHKMETYLDTADARTFARGILALADEVDGGEGEAATDSRPKVGDRVIVTEDDPDERTGEFVGLAGELASVHGGYGTPFKVKFGDGRHGPPNSWATARPRPT